MMNRFSRESIIAGLLTVTLAGPASIAPALAFDYVDQHGYRHWNFYGERQHRHAEQATHVRHGPRFVRRSMPSVAGDPPRAIAAPPWAGELVPVRTHDLGVP